MPRNSRGAGKGTKTLKQPQNPRASVDDGHGAWACGMGHVDGDEGGRNATAK